MLEFVWNCFAIYGIYCLFFNQEENKMAAEIVGMITNCILGLGCLYFVYKSFN